MSDNLRSEGWSVQPSFVANGPTRPVTLLGDEHGLTQLAGEPPVAWQTPWDQLANLQLVRSSQGLALFATVGDVRYCWRTRESSDYEALSALVSAHGGNVVRRKRRAGVLVVVIVVLLASLAGGIGAWFARGSNGAQELTDARAVNLSLKDLPSAWSLTTTSVLSYLFGPDTQVLTSTSTTAPRASSLWAHVTKQFQTCMGVSNAKDRVYGAAGQMPDYQVSSKIFGSPSFRGMEMATTSQYYATTTMVRRDTKEMSSAKFGGCFVSANAALILSAYGGATPSVVAGVAWQPITYVHGWSRGGVATINLPGVANSLHLVMVEVASGRYEVTLGAIVASWSAAKLFLANVVNTLLSRMTSGTSAAV